MTDPIASDVKPFVPARDFELSRRFYKGLGWTENWSSDTIAELELGGARIYLQNYYAEEWANNSMLYIDVDDAGAWHNLAEKVISEGDYGDARVQPPKAEDYATVTYVWDPCGVLLHFAKAKASA